MDVQDIDIVRLEFLQRIIDRVVERFGAVTTKVGDNLALLVLVLEGAMEVVVRGELGCEHNLVSIISCTQPLAELDLAFLILIVIRRVNEIATKSVIMVEYRECGLLGTFSQKGLPVGKRVTSAKCALKGAPKLQRIKVRCIKG